MSTPAHILFERAAEGGGQLLQVERLAESSAEGTSLALLLTFDVGRILVTVEAGQLRGDHLASGEDRPSGLVDAAEEEPWWRLLGSPITRVGPESADGFDIQFRHDDANPRRVRLRATGAQVSVRLVD